MEHLTLNERVAANPGKFFLAFFLGGLFDYNGYIMVSAGASNLAEIFGRENIMPLYGLSLIMFNGLARIFYAKFLLKTQHLQRFMVCSLLMLVSFVLIAVCCFDPGDSEFWFWVSLLAAVLQGIPCAIGESSALGFLKGFPSQCVGYFSSGTGFSGIFGDALLISLAAAGLSDGWIFTIATPTVIPFALSWIWLVRETKKHPFVEESRESEVQTEEQHQLVQDYSGSVEETNLKRSVAHDESANVQLTWATTKDIIGRVGGPIWNMTIVYYLEYTITVGWSTAAILQITDRYPERK